MNPRFLHRALIRYTASGHILISPRDDPDWIVDAMLATGYDEEFCLALDFEAGFVADLMKAGFLVMSAKLGDEPEEEGEAPHADPPANPLPQYLLLPKLHLERSALFFPDLHVTKTIRRFLPRYELRVDGVPAGDIKGMEALFSLSSGPASDFDYILRRCVEVHDDEWLTEPLRDLIRQIRARPELPVRPLSFGVYREGKLRAGEFGILAGKVYTSYSGYYDEDNAGSAQMILTARYLEQQGAPFWDLGMPLEYKEFLGAKNIDPFQFVELFRSGQVW